MDNRDLISYTRAYLYGQQDETVSLREHRQAWDAWTEFMACDYQFYDPDNKALDLAKKINFDFLGSDIVFLSEGLQERTQKTLGPFVRWSSLLRKEHEQDNKKTLSWDDERNFGLPSYNDEISFWPNYFGNCNEDDRGESVVLAGVSRLAERLFANGFLSPNSTLMSTYFGKPITFRTASLLYNFPYEFSAASASPPSTAEELADLYIAKSVALLDEDHRAGRDLAKAFRDTLFPLIDALDPNTVHTVPESLRRDFGFPEKIAIGLISVFYLCQITTDRRDDADIIHENVSFIGKHIAEPKDAILTLLRGQSHDLANCGEVFELFLTETIQRCGRDDKKDILLDILQNPIYEQNFAAANSVFWILRKFGQDFSGVLTDDDDVDVLSNFLIEKVLREKKDRDILSNMQAKRNYFAIDNHGKTFFDTAFDFSEKRSNDLRVAFSPIVEDAQFLIKNEWERQNLGVSERKKQMELRLSILHAKAWRRLERPQLKM